jgi:small subunit ribosomal protein S17
MKKANKVRNVGVDVKAPEKSCKDVNCPFHGRLSVRGRIFYGTVIRKDLNNTATVEWSRVAYLPKFERYVKKRSRVKAHSPECIDAVVGDQVMIMETRPISKTKKFVVLEKSAGEKR